MLKKALLVSILLIFLFMTFGCGGGEPSAGDENNITVEVYNNTDEIIISWAAFFGPDLDEWGEDLLGDRVIEPGDTVKFLLPVANEEYSLVLFTYELIVVKGVSNITDDKYIEIGGTNKIPMLIENYSKKEIKSFYITPSIVNNWGEELLEGLTIPAESGRRFLFIDPVPEGPVESNGSGNKDDSRPENEDNGAETEEREIPEGSYYDIYYIYADGEEVVQFDVLIEGKRTITINE